MKQYINHLYFKIKVAFFYWGVWLINQLIRPNCLDVKNIPIIINNRNRLTYMKMLISSLEKRGYNNIYIIYFVTTGRSIIINDFCSFY